MGYQNEGSAGSLRSCVVTIHDMKLLVCTRNVSIASGLLQHLMRPWISGGTRFLLLLLLVSKFLMAVEIIIKHYRGVIFMVTPCIIIITYALLINQTVPLCIIIIIFQTKQQHKEIHLSVSEL